MVLVAGSIVALSGCLSSVPKLGSGGSGTVTGAAAGSTSEGENGGLEKCEQALGTVRIFEDQSLSWWRTYRRHYPKLGSTVPVLRNMIQQSNCFVIVERGQAMRAMEEERRLMSSGRLRSGSNFGNGQMVAADFTLVPSVQFHQETKSRVGSAIRNVAGSLLGSAGRLIGGGANVSSNESSTTITVIDNRSGVQVSSSVGSAKNTDISFFGFSVGGGVSSRVSSFSDTPEGKVVLAAFVDSYNQMVRALRNYKPQTVAGGLGKGGTLQVGGDDDQVEAIPAPAPAPDVRQPAPAPAVTVATTSSSSVRVRENENFDVTIDTYDEDAFRDYYDALKSVVEFLPSLGFDVGAGMAPNGMQNDQVRNQIAVVWRLFANRLRTSKTELEMWPVEARKKVWKAYGKRIEKFNRMFEKERARVVEDENVPQMIRHDVARLELVTRESLFEF